MLSLPSSLITAISAQTRCPALTLTAEDHILHFGQMISTSGNADAWSDLIATGDGNLVRVRITRGTNPFAQSFQWQRITDPTNASQWQTWNTFAGSSNVMYEDGGCALSIVNGVLQAYAQQVTGSNALRYWQSSDYGQTWSGTPGTVATPPASGHTQGIASAGQNDCFFCYTVTGGTVLGCCFWTGSAWSSLQTWTLPPVPLTAGLAVAWLNGSYTIVYSDGSALKSCQVNSSGSVWTELPDIAPANSSALSRISPRLAFFDGLYQLTCIECDFGTLTGTTYAYPRVRQSADMVHFSSGFILHDMQAQEGACYTHYIPGNSGIPTYLLATMSTIAIDHGYQTSNSSRYQDLSGYVLYYQRTNRIGAPGKLIVTLDNTGSRITSQITPYTGGNYQAIGLTTSLRLSEGYKTGTPPTVPTTIQVGIYHIQQITFERGAGINQVTIEAEDLSSLLDLVNRYQMTYTNQTPGWLLTEICVRAGLSRPMLPGTSQINTILSTFILHAGQKYRAAIDELCQIGWLEYFLDQNEVLQFRELSGSDSSVWSYAPELETLTLGNRTQSGNHSIITGHAPVGAPTGTIISGEAYDDTSQHMIGREQLIMDTDPRLTSSSLCTARATFLLQQAQRDQYIHTITIPNNPALQPLDVLTLSDQSPPIGTGQHTTARIIQTETTYQPDKGLYTLHMQIEGV